MRRQESHFQDELTLAAHNSAVRTGIWSGVSMAVVFIAWLFIANRMPASESFALERNVITASILAILFMIPVVRFMWQAGRLLAASLTAWWIFSLVYRLLCVAFSGLPERYTPMRVFILGSVVCMILATLSWIVTVIWRTRESHMASHHRVSHSNHHV
ncbi:MAG: hypothetical protein JO119_14345 [Acidobacteria bacterium]|nr:hypothetical protein [Acidobacteriota bacterium]